MQRRATYGTTDLSFKIAIGGSLLHFSFNNFTHREIKLFRHNKFLLQYWYIERIENNNYKFFCKAQSMLESYVLTGRFKSSCYCNMYQYSVIITVDTENAMINARSTKLCL